MIINWLGVWLPGKMVEWLSSFPYIHLIFQHEKVKLRLKKAKKMQKIRKNRRKNLLKDKI